MKKLFFFFMFFASAFAKEDSFTWLQLMPGNTVWLRYISENIDKCPSAKVDGQKLDLEVYSKKTKDFPLACKLSFKTSDLPKSILLEGEEINLNFNNKKIKKIAIIGDTGCRVHRVIKQDCKSSWYFEQIANAMLEHNPDLILHVGDYIYREDGYKDEWQTWYQDFFAPAKKALSVKVPWLMVRGNHEDCKRAGKGWFSLLSDDLLECNNHQNFYDVEINNIDFLVTDSTLEEELINDLSIINTQNYQKEKWLITHRPLLYLDKSGNSVGYKKIFSSLKESITTVISGHVHALQFLEFNGKRQFISGNGGVLLDFYKTKATDSCKMEYGFSVLEFTDENFVNLVGYNKENERIFEKSFPLLVLGNR